MRKTLISTLLRPWVIVSIASMVNVCLADTPDDCSVRVPLSKVIPELSRGCPDEKKMDKGPNECIPISSPIQTNSISKFDIDIPGHYCLSEDLHARIEFGDHPAEGAMIVIWASNVVLDLQGHTLGRGRLLKNPGGNGIKIVDKYTNIHIMNGTLQDFHTGVFHDSAKYPAVEEVPTYDARLNTYRFPKSGVVLENITFKNNKENFRIRIPREQKR